jgi:hypothetical protein
MKRKIIIACIVGILSVVNCYAKNPGTALPGYKEVLQMFIDSHMTFDYKKLKKILDENASYRISRGDQIVVQPKDELLDQMRSVGKYQQPCTNSYVVLSESDGMVVARVDFVYENGSQQNYVMLGKNDDKEWKIMQVYKIFKTDKAQATGDNLSK